MESISPACLREFCDVSGCFFQPKYKNDNNEAISVTENRGLCAKVSLVQMRRDKRMLVGAVGSHPDPFRGQCTHPHPPALWESPAHNCPFFGETLWQPFCLGEVLILVPQPGAKTGSSVWPTFSSCCCCSVTKPCPTLHDPMDCSRPGFSALYHLTEVAQTHVHWVGDAIQPSHPLSSPSLPALDLSGSFPMSLIFASGGQSIGTSASLILTWTKSELQSSPSDEAQTSLQLRLKPLKCVWWGGGGWGEGRGLQGSLILYASAHKKKKNSARGTVVDKNWFIRIGCLWGLPVGGQEGAMPWKLNGL